MSDGSGEGDDAVLTDFLEAYLADRERGSVRSLDDYLVQFPGHAEAIAKEFLSLEKGDAIAREHRTGKHGTPALADIATGDAAGDRMGPYRVLDEIGRGGQGIVYLAEDTRLHRKVALKVLKGMGSFSKDAVARFRREAEAASRLDHPGICAVYEAALDGKVPYIAMRLVEGESLAAKIASAKSQGEPSAETSFVHLAEVEVPLAPRPVTDPSPTPSGPTTRAEIMRIVHLLEKAARALHAAHEAGVIHRDMKPGNVMVTPEGEAVIMDFGLAYLEDEQLPTLTQTGEFFGTPAYMSPEQLLAQRVRLDRRTDVWSLGVMLYECVTLTRPFDAATREGVYQAIQTKQPLDPRRINRSVPDEIRVVIETALEKDRDRRYQTALDFAEELRRVRCFEPIRAKPAGPILRFRRWAQRNPVLATAVGGLFAVLTVGLATSLVLLGNSERERVAKESALAQVTKERNEKQAALNDITGWARLGELTELQNLITESNASPWPASSEKVRAIEAWLKKAAEVADRLPAHRAALEAARAQARPYGEDAQTRDRESFVPEMERLAVLGPEIESLQKVVAAPADGAGAPTPETRKNANERIAMLEGERKELESKVSQRVSWGFDSPADQFKHDQLAILVRELDVFLGEPRDDRPTRKGVAARFEFARTVRKRTIDDYAANWRETITQITRSPHYGGLRIREQAGLVPLGPDPVTGLFEFAELQTGEPPVRDPGTPVTVAPEHGMVFVLIPGGTFKMGAQRTDPDKPNYDPDARNDEFPPHDVTLSAFFISKFEMTQGQWLRFTGLNPSLSVPGKRFRTGSRTATIQSIMLSDPVEQVTWDGCTTVLSHLGLVLPTEAQWEYAARAGTKSSWWCGDDKPELQKMANLADHSFAANGGTGFEDWDDGFVTHTQVGAFPANRFGLHCVIGNVWEWCRDGKVSYDVVPQPGDGLRKAVGARTRVMRGGSFAFPAASARSAQRGDNPPAARVGNIGVRPARAIDP